MGDTKPVFAEINAFNQTYFFWFHNTVKDNILFYLKYYRNVVFLSASVLGVLVVLSVYDEDVLTVEHVLTIITILTCILAAAR